MREAGTHCETCTIKQVDNQFGFPLEFKDNHKQRFVIVKNIQPQCTDAFDDQIKNKPSSLQTQNSVLTHSSDLNKKEGAGFDPNIFD